MHDQHTVAAPLGPDRNDTREVWVACWWCGLPLDLGETDLCAPCTDDLHPLAGGWHVHGTGTPDSPPLTHSARLPDDAVHQLTYAAVDHDIERVTTAGTAWAHEHQLTTVQVNRYVDDLQQCATTRLHALAVRDLQAIAWGNQLHAEQLWDRLIEVTR